MANYNLVRLMLILGRILEYFLCGLGAFGKGARQNRVPQSKLYGTGTLCPTLIKGGKLSGGWSLRELERPQQVNGVRL